MVEINELVEHVKDESQAMNLLHILEEKFGWAGTVFTRDDVAQKAERKLTEEEWEKVRTSHSWRHMGDHLTQDGWDFVDEALIEAGVVEPFLLERD